MPRAIRTKKTHGAGCVANLATSALEVKEDPSQVPRPKTEVSLGYSRADLGAWPGGVAKVEFLPRLPQ